MRIFANSKTPEDVDMEMLANIGLEAAVVGVVCSVFLILFVVAGVREIYKKED
ncbi:MAG: hypothetical protein ACI9S8_001592 [Chlamydiales bacterium]